MSDKWFSNPRLEMAYSDYAPDDDGHRGRLEADLGLEELADVSDEYGLYSDEVNATRLQREGEDDE